MDNIKSSLNAIQQDKLMSYAVKNVQQQMSTLKTSKEIKTDDDQHDEVKDSIELSASKHPFTEAEYLDAAQHSGVISEFTPKTKKKETKDKERVELGTQAEVKDEAKSDKAAAAKSKKEVEKVELDNRIARVKSDVPQEMYEAARKIVEGQIDVRSNQPAKTLAAMKPIPETGALEMKAAAYHPIMDIHDDNNMPMASVE